MWKFGEVNAYEGEFDLRKFVQDMQDYLQQHDEALYVCDLSRLEKQFAMWQKYMPRVFPYYAIKCNDDAFIVKTMAELGASFDCASKTEIEQVLALGVSPERIIFANPCKLVSHLEYAKSVNVNTVTVDNEFEIYKIFKHAKDTNLVVRFRSEAKEAQCPLGDKFGCDVESDVSPLMLLAKSLDMSVTGTSFHVGSGCNDLPAYGRAITSAKSIFKFGQMLGFDMDLVDIGGGFPGDNVEKFEKITHIVNESLDKHFPQDNIRIIAEPGRYFVASAFNLLCKIYAKREVRLNGRIDTKMYYLNDGVYGSFNCILYDHQHVTAEHFLNEDAKKFKSLIWGPTCDALDKITEDIQLPNLSCGDILAFPNMGAYTMPVASPFNGFPLPKAVYLKAQTMI